MRCEDIFKTWQNFDQNRAMATVHLEKESKVLNITKWNKNLVMAPNHSKSILFRECGGIRPLIRN